MTTKTVKPTPAPFRRGGYRPPVQSDEVLAAKIAAMKGDAQEFEHDRIQRVTKHRKDIKDEENQEKKGGEFIGGVLKTAFATEHGQSMEDRLRRNVHYLQRGEDDDSRGFLNKVISYFVSL